MFPPPMTKPTCTPSPRRCCTSREMNCSTEKSMPEAALPFRASPLSYSTTLLYNAAMGVSICRRLADCGLAADFEAHKPRDYDVLASLGNHRLDELVDRLALITDCLLYTSDAADDLLCVDLGGRRIIKKKKKKKKKNI